ncbi:MAG: SGNH/GDSL hydrolase family protein [Anaerolineae bacterium]|nr:SGNH/GDSL hydrolase family protein [Anaerolineae bacterium]
MYWLVFISILLLGLGLIVGAFLTYRRWWPSETPKRRILENLTLGLLGLFIILMMAEIYFKLFFAQTDGYTFVLAAQNWRQKYWQPINSLGYRDREWTPEDVAGKTRVMVVGDSFVAGTGIKNYEDRFPNQLAKLLGPEYAVFVVASPGWSTENEIKAMIDYPHAPDILILSYFINDIEQAAYNRGFERPEFVSRPTGIWGSLVNNSYALNFLYWRWYRFTQPPPRPDYLTWIASLYRNPELWWQHRQELFTIIEGAHAENIPLLVVVFPSLDDVEKSRSITQIVVDFFREQNVPVLDISSLLAGRDPAETTTSPLDAHPNQAVNLEIAGQLYQMIRDINK